jgi:hypothetical protein
LGDALNFTVLLDNKMAGLTYPLDPKFNILQLTKPGDMTDTISMPKPVISSVSCYLDT